MKSHFKNILLLGGIYAAGSITLAYFSSFVAEAAGLLWLAVCAATLVKLVWTTRAVGEVCETPAQTGVFSDGNRMAPVCGYVVFFCFVCRRYCDNGRIGQTGID